MRALTVSQYNAVMTVPYIFIPVPVPLDVPEHQEKKLIPKPTEITDTQRYLTRRENKAH